MSATSSTEIQELKDFIKNGFNQLDRKIDDKFNELDRKIDNVKFELKQEITEVRGDIKALKGEINTVEARVKNLETAAQTIPEITEKFGELKNWLQIAFLIIVVVVGWFAKSGRI